MTMSTKKKSGTVYVQDKSAQPLFYRVEVYQQKNGVAIDKTSVTYVVQAALIEEAVTKAFRHYTSSRALEEGAGVFVDAELNTSEIVLL
jgi:hypothetical protein